MLEDFVLQETDEASVSHRLKAPNVLPFFILTLVKCWPHTISNGKLAVAGSASKGLAIDPFPQLIIDYRMFSMRPAEKQKFLLAGYKHAAMLRSARERII